MERLLNKINVQLQEVSSRIFFAEKPTLVPFWSATSSKRKKDKILNQLTGHPEKAQGFRTRRGDHNENAELR